MQLWVIYKKELMEMWRNYKWIWVPLVFIFLGIMQPLSTYFLPQIIEQFGGLPEGAVIDIPMPSPHEMMVNTLSQFTSIGILIVVLAFMGIVNYEIVSGIAEMIMVKPVRYSNFIIGKWLGSISLALVSLFLGNCAAWYYTDLFFGSVDLMQFVIVFLLYSIWFVFVLSVTLFFSTFIKSNGGVAASTLLTTILISLFPNIVPKIMKYSPSTLTTYADQYFISGTMNSEFYIVLTISILAIIVILISTIYLFRSSFHSS